MNQIVLENEQPLDVFSRLLNERIIFINDIIDDSIATEISATLIQKDIESNDTIHIFINSEGGNIKDILTIYDVMKMLKSQIRTVAIGTVAQESVLLLAAGTKGMRFATQNSTIVLSQVYHEGSYYSDLTDATMVLDLIKKHNSYLMKELSSCMNKKEKSLEKELMFKKYLSASEAVSYGVIDKVVQ